MHHEPTHRVAPGRFLGLGAAILWSALALAVPARAAVDVHIDIGNAPPAQRLVFRSPPRQVFEPTSHVYVVDDPALADYDCFRYGGFYWLFSNGYWYRSASWRGRFTVVAPQAVPAVIYRVPDRRWKHGAAGPPGLQNKPGGMPPGQYKKMYGGDNGKGHGKGNGHGH